MLEKGPVEIYRDALAARGLPTQEPELEASWSAAIDAARAAWPEVSLPPDQFALELARRVDTEHPIDSLHTSDLYIAAACARGDELALRAFERRFFPELDAALARLRLSPDELGELAQRLRHDLFVARDGGPAHISEYRAHGELAGWLKVSAVRLGLKLLKARGRAQTSEDDALLQSLPSPAQGPELEYMKSEYRPAFRAAFQAALDSLSSRQQNLLRQQVVDGLSIDELARLYRVHRATTARWLARAREQLIERTRREFVQRAAVDRSECDSIIFLVQSQLDITIKRRLAEIAGEE